MVLVLPHFFNEAHLLPHRKMRSVATNLCCRVSFVGNLTRLIYFVLEHVYIMKYNEATLNGMGMVIHILETGFIENCVLLHFLKAIQCSPK